MNEPIYDDLHIAEGCAEAAAQKLLDWTAGFDGLEFSLAEMESATSDAARRVRLRLLADKVVSLQYQASEVIDGICQELGMTTGDLWSTIYID